MPVTGNRAKRVVYGALNIGTGAICLDEADRWNQASFQDHLRHLRSLWRGWNLVLFLDRGSPHTARASRALARRLGIEVRLLPTACPELNPVEGLWRLLKGQVLANEPTPDLDASLKRALDHLRAMTPRQRRKAAGVLSGCFWLPTYVADDDLPALYAGATVFAFPSLYEGFGMPIVEAQACGTVVVTSDLPELREAGGEECLYVQTTEAGIRAGLVEALQRPRPEPAAFRAPSWAEGGRVLANNLECLAGASR